MKQLLNASGGEGGGLSTYLQFVVDQQRDVAITVHGFIGIGAGLEQLLDSVDKSALGGNLQRRLTVGVHRLQLSQGRVDQQRHRLIKSSRRCEVQRRVTAGVLRARVLAVLQQPSHRVDVVLPRRYMQRGLAVSRRDARLRARYQQHRYIQRAAL